MHVPDLKMMLSLLLLAAAPPSIARAGEVVERPADDPLLLNHHVQTEAEVPLKDLGPEPQDVDAPLPAFAGGVAIEVASLSDEGDGFMVFPRAAASQRFLTQHGLLWGMDLVAAPQTGQASYIQANLGFGLKQAIPHVYGAAQSAQTRYEEALPNGEQSSFAGQQARAYEVLEGGTPVGWVSDMRSIGVIAAPRLHYQRPQDDESALSVAAFMGLYGFFQRGPTWVESEPVRGKVAPTTSYFGEAGAVYHRGAWYGEVAMSIVGGPGIVGFSRRHLYGRLSGRMGPQGSEIAIGLGTGHQFNGAMAVMPPMPHEK